MTTNNGNVKWIPVPDSDKLIREMTDGQVVFLSVWEPISGLLQLHGHGSVASVDGNWYGCIGTRSLPEEMDALNPFSDQGKCAVRSFIDGQYEESYALINAQYYDLIFTHGAIYSMGNISLDKGWKPNH